MYTMGMNGTKWHIFNVAIDMFADNSYHSVSMRDLARAVGIQSSSIYNHFASKEDLLTSIFAYYNHYAAQTNPSRDSLIKIAESDLSPRQVLAASVTIFPEELQLRMDKIILIAIKETHDIDDAGNLIYHVLIDMPTQNIGAMLNHMIEIGKIPPIDIDTIVLMYANFCYACALRRYTSHPVSLDEYRAGLELLSQMLPEQSLAHS